MLWTVLALAVALFVPLVTGGSYTRLLEKPWRWGSFLVGGLGLQLVLDVAPIPKSHWHDIGFGLLVASYVLLLGFCGRNTLITGMSVVCVGIFLNAFVITIDQGMPVKVPADWERTGRIEPSIKHHPRVPGDHLLVLTDIIVLRSPFNTILSFGDLILAVGLCDVTYRASRKPRRRAVTRRKPRPASRMRTRPEPAAVAPAAIGAPGLITIPEVEAVVDVRDDGDELIEISDDVVATHDNGEDDDHDEYDEPDGEEAPALDVRRPEVYTAGGRIPIEVASDVDDVSFSTAFYDGAQRLEDDRVVRVFRG
jgi:Family of unknown function (DUF5317)